MAKKNKNRTSGRKMTTRAAVMTKGGEAKLVLLDNRVRNNPRRSSAVTMMTKRVAMTATMATRWWLLRNEVFVSVVDVCEFFEK